LKPPWHEKRFIVQETHHTPRLGISFSNPVIMYRLNGTCDCHSRKGLSRTEI
jgi:hypothetical protein